MKTLQYFAAILLSAASLTGYGQDDQMVSNAQQNIVTDQSLLKAIAPYNDDVRNDILVATQYPDVLGKLAGIREKSSAGFQQIIQNYAQKKQNWFYEVSRYPDLMHKLAMLPRKTSHETIDGMLANVNPSPELKEAAWKLYNNHHGDLVAVDNLNEEASSSFQSMIALLDPDAQHAFKTLEEMPDVLSLLNDHSDLVTRLGERFKDNPADVRNDLAGIHDQMEAQNKEELAAYQDELKQNPQAMQELNQASQEYASQGGYSYPAPTGDKVVNYGSPYSYWFGYPYWYGSPMWYPGLYGYGSGFYFGLGGYPMVYAMPSLGFSRWFFGGAYRYYPHLYRQYDHYYHTIAPRNYMYSPRTAFIGSAARHFNPSTGSRSYLFDRGQGMRSAPRSINAQSYRSMPRSNSFSAPSRSYGSFGGRTFNGGGGGFSRGGFSGGGFRGGRR
ncbi:hypothetical protein [Dyadobacter jiangsuensis]|uniref:DUF3300 domain-containing protein n=1 Tax=Dyadobacter jiangsuensis TaxID=1591085 RepID=A0A2P8G1J5_9BACT|nr:hypothetical protein [Dyadobacter jiangsuensis]PSL27755.1 hypothetical protein CLV60_10720 [Dyadobacter jiangsuensis]